MGTRKFELDLDRCIEVLDDNGYKVWDLDNDEDFKEMVDIICDWIDSAYKREMDTKAIEYLVEELEKRKDKIEALYYRLMNI